MIVNKTRGVAVSLTEEKAYDDFSQAVGLMFSKKRNLVMRFNKPRYVSLHNVFVFHPLEVLLLDKNQKVIAIENNFKPFTFWNYKRKKAIYVVELAKEGSKNICKIGDQLEIK